MMLKKKNMYEDKPTLSIKEIADLKEGRKTLEELTKTHDGTSMGTIGPILDELCRTHGNSERVIAYDENGKKVYDIDDDKHTRRGAVGVQNLERDMSKLEGKAKDLHCVVGENSGLSNRTVVDINYGSGQLNIPNYNQLKSLCTTNDEGDYLLRSYTMISDNSTRMTFIKTNNFNKSNHKEYRQICKDIGKESKKYNKEFQDIVEEKAKRIKETHKPTRITGGYSDTYDYQQIYTQARREALKDYGSWEDRVMKDKGFVDKLEQCNVKFRMSYKYTDE